MLKYINNDWQTKIGFTWNCTTGSIHTYCQGCNQEFETTACKKLHYQVNCFRTILIITYIIIYNKYIL